MTDYNILEIIKSALELKKNYNFLNPLITQISDDKLCFELKNELIRNNYGNALTLVDNYLFDNFTNIFVYGSSDIKQFEFDFIENLNIKEIKVELETNTLYLNTMTNIKGDRLEYFSHWDNANRFMVVIKKKFAEKIKQDLDRKLNITKKLNIGKLGYYTKFLITDFEEDSEIELMQAMDDEAYSGHRNNTNWEHYNDDLDMDQQDPKFWNQF